MVLKQPLFEEVAKESTELSFLTTNIDMNHAQWVRREAQVLPIPDHLIKIPNNCYTEIVGSKMLESIQMMNASEWRGHSRQNSTGTFNKWK